MKISVQPEYISVACNRTPEIVDWNSDGVICYGATNAILLYNTKQVGGNSLTVLSHHKSKVNSVKWLRKPDGSSTEFLSCSADKSAAIWTVDNGVYKVTSQLEGHSEGVTSIGGLYLNGNDLVIYTASIDSSVRIWERRDGFAALKQIISLNSGLCLTLHAHLLPLVSRPLLLLALDDHKVHIYAATSMPGEAGDVEEYHRLHTLVGHEDWVRGLDVLHVDKDTILVASCSQDTYIRLWRIQHHKPDAQPTAEIKVEQRLFTAYGEEWSVKLDAVLAGHEGWVYGVQWAPCTYDKGKLDVLVGHERWACRVQWAPCTYDKETNSKIPTYRLLSSSLDKTLIIWEPESTPEGSAGSGVWVESIRVGEVGGNGLGFYGSRFGPKQEFLGHGYNGSFHMWRYSEESGLWSSSVVCGGHFGAVEDVRWEPREGRYLVSVSADQTTRVHAPWARDDGTAVEWHEVARPQVHGYDMAALAMTSSCTLASAAEEKVIRVFRAPHYFLNNFSTITGAALAEGAANGGGPEGASVPSLGLSNKAVFTGDDDKADSDGNDGYFVPLDLTEPPTEETLMQNTLWPEVQKLYGHGYEVFCLDASPDGTLLASACKATVAEHASLLLWETTNWQQIQKLTSHQLTVTQIAFSPDSQQLLSVSRDRRWTLYHRIQGSNSFELAATTDKTNGVHSRIIWCCAWAHDSAVFATGSREGKVCVWSKTDSDSETSLRHHAIYGKPLELTTSVTALSLAPLEGADTRLVAAGLDSGIVRLYSFGRDVNWSLLIELDNSAAHHLTVKRLMFSPRGAEQRSDSRDLLLASCGADHLVRIHTVSIFV